MKNDPELQSCEPPATSGQLPASGSELAGIVRRVRAVLTRVLGVPDYDVYLAHMGAKHPETTPLSRDEFSRTRLTERYSRPGARCC